MKGYFYAFISIFLTLSGVFSYPFFIEAATSYEPGEVIAMTGSNGEVFFDIADDIYLSGTSIGGPVFDTILGTFSGAFYLSGAGWVDFATGSYSVALDCGVEYYSGLTLPCTLSGVAYGEIVGDVIFDRQVIFDPTTGLLSGTASTYLGIYDFSGITFPLMPARLSLGNRVTADHEKYLTFSGTELYSGIVSPWDMHIETSPGGLNVSYISGSPVDLSHASTYRVEITDPDGGTTVIDDFEVIADRPSSILYTTTPTIRAGFCTGNPASLLCPDGAILESMTLDSTQTITPMIANGIDTHDITLKLRDRYGNETKEGSIRVEYADTIRTIQANPLEYMGDNCTMPYCALIETGLFNDHFGNPNTGSIPLPTPNISFSFASITPSSSIDMLSLSGIVYTDGSGVSIDVADPAWKAPLGFDPWYTTSILPPASIGVGDTIDFATTYTHVTSVPSPSSPTAIYSIAIGTNTPSAFTGFTSLSTITCAKYYMSSGISECDWIGLPDPVIISTEALSFSGLYGYGGYEPPPETVSYTSYIRYSVLHPLLAMNIVTLYPSASGSLGTSLPGDVRMKILGQHNLPNIAGIQEKNISDIWNALKKNISLISRNRTLYNDVPYILTGANISVSDIDFTSTSPEKRTIMTLGGDITITSDIIERESIVAIIALTDSGGNGGNIIIDPSVSDIHAILLAEKIVSSTGSNQLYIHGSVISHNTTSDSVCPYYVSPCVNPELYNLENLRKDFSITPGTLSSSLEGKYPTIPLVIEYDGRVMTDPPPILDK